jgi:hypothetical protein
VIVTSGIESVHVVKVNVFRLPPIVVAEEFDVAVAVKLVLLQLTEPTPVTRAALLDEVFVIVVEPVRSPPPGSLRRDVDADAELEPSARRARAATAASVANFRIDINPPICT